MPIPAHPSAPEPNALLTGERDGYRLKWKNDGTDYPAIWEAFRRGELSGPSLSRPRRRLFRETRLVEAGGRRFLVKRDWHVEKRLEKRFLYWFMRGTRYSRLIEFVNRAVGHGCNLVQDIYFVAEKMDGNTCLEAWLIADFMPGVPLERRDVAVWADELGRTVLKIHEWGLACNDIQPYNFIRTDQGVIKAIDMDMSSPVVVCQVNDLWRMRSLFGLKAPWRGGPLKRFLWAVIGVRNFVRSYTRRLRGRPNGL